MKSMLIFAASAMSASLLVPTLAEARTSEGFENSSQSVRYDDLDLASARGQATLDRRISRAAREVCGDFNEQTIAISQAVSSCVKEARAQTARSVQLAVARAASRPRRA